MATICAEIANNEVTTEGAEDIKNNNCKKAKTQRIKNGSKNQRNDG